ncbi:MAG: hypothetical protein GC159_01080 [Phycisphaera sp.]|nr:hypothetical protein [Phycisphaera sp.]
MTQDSATPSQNPNQAFDWNQHSEDNSSRVMGEGQDPAEVVWTYGQLRDAYRQMLMAPIQHISRRLRGTEQHVAILANQASPPIKTFADLVRHSKPPLHLLDLAKNFAKAAFHTSTSIPAASSLMLYYLVICVAFLRYDKKITSLAEEQLRENIVDRLSEPWIDAGTQQILTQALTKWQSVDDLLEANSSDDSDVFPAM